MSKDISGEINKAIHHCLNSIDVLSYSKSEFANEMNKTASLFSIAKGALKGGRFLARGAYRGTKGALKTFGSGLKPTSKSAPLGEKVFGGATKLVALGATGYGGYKAYEHSNRPRSSNNYTTHLRNNLLAGRIQPGQLKRHELVSVKDLGMN